MMLRQDRQSGTITRKQEAWEGGGRGSGGTALHRKDKRGTGVKGRPIEQLGDSGHRHRGLFSCQKRQRDRDKEKGQTQDIGKRERGRFSLPLILRPLHKPFLDGVLHFFKAAEKKKGYWQAKYRTAEKQCSNLLE